MSLASRRPAAVFDAIERGRAVSRRLTAVTPPADESADLLAELRALTEVLKVIGADPAAAQEARGIRQRVARLEHQLSAISWRAIGAGDVSPRTDGIRGVGGRRRRQGRGVLLPEP